jgi:hypothetical protein
MLLDDADNGEPFSVSGIADHAGPAVVILPTIIVLAEALGPTTQVIGWPATWGAHDTAAPPEAPIPEFGTELRSSVLQVHAPPVMLP